MRQAADEADRVGDEVAAAVVLEAARRRVERLEEPVLDRHLGAGERVQERRLADVRVAGERDRRHLRAAALLAARRALPLEVRSSRFLSTETRRRASRRSVSSCDSPGPRVPTPPPRRSRCCHMPAHARQVVLELRELDLELPLGAHGVLGEDVEDQLRPVDHARRRARPRGSAAAPDRARRRRAGSRPPRRRSAPRAPRACPCRRRCAAPGGCGAGRRGRPARRPPCARAPRPRRARRRDPLPAPEPRGRTRAPAPGNVESSGGIMPAVPPESRTSRSGRSRSSTSRRRRATRRSSTSYVKGTWTRCRCLRRRRVAPLRDAGRQAARAARRAHRHRAGAGQPARPDRGRRRARPRRDRHEGRPRGDDRARAAGRPSAELAYDLGLLFFPREELGPDENPLPGVFEATPLVDEAALVICLEPTDNTLQLGCLGNINARVVFEGRAAHSARPWLGVNAITLALEGLRAGARARAARRRRRRARLPRGAERDADRRLRQRDQRRSRAGRGDAELPLRADRTRRGGRGAPARARRAATSRSSRTRPAAPVALSLAARRAAPRRRRVRGAAEAGVDERRRLRRARPRRGQPRPRRDALRAHAPTSRSRSPSSARTYEALQRFLLGSV